MGDFPYVVGGASIIPFLFFDIWEESMDKLKNLVQELTVDALNNPQFSTTTNFVI